MAVTIPSGLALPSFSEVALGKPILASSWRGLNRAANRMFADAGFNANGRTGIGSSPIWQSTSGSYTQVDSSSRDTMSSYTAVFNGWRFTQDPGARLEIALFGEDAEVEATLYDLTSGSLLATATCLLDAPVEWGLLAFALNRADVEIAPNVERGVALALRARWRGLDTSAQLYCWHARERVLGTGDASLLP